METPFKRGQTCHDRENSESAVERSLASGPIWVHSHPAAPKARQNRFNVNIYRDAMVLPVMCFMGSVVSFVRGIAKDKRIN